MQKFLGEHKEIIGIVLILCLSVSSFLAGYNKGYNNGYGAGEDATYSYVLKEINKVKLGL